MLGPHEHSHLQKCTCIFKEITHKKAQNIVPPSTLFWVSWFLNSKDPKSFELCRNCFGEYKKMVLVAFQQQPESSYRIFLIILNLPTLTACITCYLVVRRELFTKTEIQETGSGQLRACTEKVILVTFQR